MLPIFVSYPPPFLLASFHLSPLLPLLYSASVALPLSLSTALLSPVTKGGLAVNGLNRHTQMHKLIHHTEAKLHKIDHFKTLRFQGETGANLQSNQSGRLQTETVCCPCATLQLGYMRPDQYPPFLLPQSVNIETDKCIMGDTTKTKAHLSNQVKKWIKNSMQR